MQISGDNNFVIQCANVHSLCCWLVLNYAGLQTWLSRGADWLTVIGVVVVVVARAAESMILFKEMRKLSQVFPFCCKIILSYCTQRRRTAEVAAAATIRHRGKKLIFPTLCNTHTHTHVIHTQHTGHTHTRGTNIFLRAAVFRVGRKFYGFFLFFVLLNLLL